MCIVIDVICRLVGLENRHLATMVFQGSLELRGKSEIRMCNHLTLDLGAGTNLLGLGERETGADNYREKAFIEEIDLRSAFIHDDASTCT